MTQKQETKIYDFRLFRATVAFAVVLACLLLIGNFTVIERLLYFLLFLFRPILAGLAIAYLAAPLLGFLEKRLPKKGGSIGRRALALTLTYGLLTTVFAGILLLILPRVAQSLKDFVSGSDSGFFRILGAANGLISKVNGFLPAGEGGKPLLPLLNEESILPAINDFLVSFRERLSGSLNIAGVQTILQNAATWIWEMLFAVFFSFYLLLFKEKHHAQILKLRFALFGKRFNRHLTEICKIADRSFGGFLRGKALDSFLVGLLTFVLCSVLQIRDALPIATIIAVTDMIPVIGPVIGTIPCVLLLLKDEPFRLLLFLIGILVIQQVDGDLLAPKILGKHTGVSSLCVMVSVIIMGGLFGLVGVLIGIPLFATILELSEHFLNARLKMQKTLFSNSRKGYKSLWFDRKKRLLPGLLFAGLMLSVLGSTDPGALHSRFEAVLRLFAPILLGLALAWLLNPVFSFLERRVFYKLRAPALRRAVALTGTYLVFLLFVSILALLILPQLVSGIAGFFANARAFADWFAKGYNAVAEWVNRSFSVLPAQQPLLQAIDAAEVESRIGQIPADVIFSVPERMITAVGGMISTVTDVTLALFLSLYILASKERLGIRILKVRFALFGSRFYTGPNRICGVFRRSFSRFLKGKLVDLLIVSFLCYPVLLALQVPYPALLAVTLGIANLIPFFGPLFCLLPATVIVALEQPEKVIPFWVAALLIQQLNEIVIAPKILGSAGGVSPLCALIAVTLFGRMWGVTGLVIAVPLLAAAVGLCKYKIDFFLRKKGLSTQTADYRPFPAPVKPSSSAEALAWQAVKEAICAEEARVELEKYPITG